MWKYLPRFVVVWAADFSHTVTACSVRAKHNIPIGHTFADSPEHAAGKSGGNFGLFGMRFLIDRNEHRVELTPAVRKLARQVAFYAIIRTNETLCKTLLCMAAALAEHKTIVFRVCH